MGGIPHLVVAPASRPAVLRTSRSSAGCPRSLAFGDRGSRLRSPSTTSSRMGEIPRLVVAPASRPAALRTSRSSAGCPRSLAFGDRGSSLRSPSTTSSWMGEIPRLVVAPASRPAVLRTSRSSAGCPRVPRFWGPGIEPQVSIHSLIVDGRETTAGHHARTREPKCAQAPAGPTAGGKVMNPTVALKHRYCACRRGAPVRAPAARPQTATLLKRCAEPPAGARQAAASKASEPTQAARAEAAASAGWAAAG